jgi:hypothetical protein
MPLAGWHDVRLTDDVLLAPIAMVKYYNFDVYGGCDGLKGARLRLGKGQEAARALLSKKTNDTSSA